MKNIVKYICVALVLSAITGCNPYETWSEGRPDLEHVYYVATLKTGNGLAESIIHEIAADGTARFYSRIQSSTANQYELITSEVANVTCPIGIRFISERVRSYDAVTYFWVESVVGNLIAGTDYTVLTESGSPLAAGANGGYALTWAQAKKAQQFVKIKRLTSEVGELRILFLDRAKIGDLNFKFTCSLTSSQATAFPVDLRRDPEKMTNNQTSEYAVRSIWSDFNFPCVIKFL